MVDIYYIRVQGHLDSSWSGWFEGMEVRCYKDGTTELAGTIPDQAALHGLLGKIRDLSLPLVSVNRVRAEED